MIELYAITDHPGPPLPDVASLRAVGSRDLAAVWAPAVDGDITADALWHYERVVEALMEDRDLLPMRYGTRLDDEAAAAHALEGSYDRLLTSLNYVRGAVELAVRALTAEPAPAAVAVKPESGTAYMRARSREVAAEADAAHAIHDPLVALARAGRLRPTSLPGERLRAAYLVNEEDTERFSALVTRLQADNPSLRLTCTGPWPAYSFAQS